MGHRLSPPSCMAQATVPMHRHCSSQAGWGQVSPAPEVDRRSRGCLWVPWGDRFQAGMAGGPVLEGRCWGCWAGRARGLAGWGWGSQLGRGLFDMGLGGQEMVGRVLEVGVGGRGM